MSPTANVRAIRSLEELKGALGRFGGETREALQAAEQEIRRTLDWLQERLNYWRSEVRRRQEEVRQAEADLDSCLASGYDDEDGRAPNCSAEEHALRQAQVRLREAEAELQNVQRWMKAVDEAVAQYHVQARRLQNLAAVHTEKAQAFLGRTIADLERYLAVEPPSVPSLGVASSEQPGVSVSAYRPEITWAEKRAILERVDAGQPITPEDLRLLQQPASDLQAETLVEDEAWLQQLVESERYREAMRDSQEAENLKEALLATLKAINYWRSKP